MTLVEDVPKTRQQKKLEWEFFSLSGYGPSDLLSVSYETNTFLTRGGGKYRLENSKLIHLDGPDWDPTERV